MVRQRHLTRARSGDEVEVVEVVAEPHKLVVWSGRWYLIGFSQNQGTWGSYRLDRISDLHVPGWRFTPQVFPAGDVTAFIQLQPDRGDDADAWPCRGTVRMDCPVDLVAKWAPGGANFESIDDATTRIASPSTSSTSGAAIRSRAASIPPPGPTSRPVPGLAGLPQRSFHS